MDAPDDAETLKERQENELQVLQSIYLDVTDLRSDDAWQVERSPEIRITLHPQESMGYNEAHVCVDLYVNCPSNYPEEVPVLELQNAKGVSTQLLAILVRELHALAKKLVGEVMLLQLCQHVQTYLHAHNRPAGRESFYEQMLTNQREQQQRRMKEAQRHEQLQRRLQEKQLQEIEDVIEKRNEAAKAEVRRRKDLVRKHGRERQLSDESINGVSPTDKTAPTDIRSANRHARNRCTSTSRGSAEDTSKFIVFHTKQRKWEIYRGKCLGHSQHDRTTYVGLDAESGELVTVISSQLRWPGEKTHTAVDAYLKQVASIGEEVTSLCSLQHKNLLHYHAYSYELLERSVTVNVLTEHVGGGSLLQCVKHGEPLQMAALKHYASQILEALSYLHENAVIHRDLKLSSLLLDSNGTVRMTDYSISKRLADLVHLVSNGGAASGDSPMVPCGDKSTDLKRVGLVLFSLALGRVIDTWSEPLPVSLPPPLRSLLTLCMQPETSAAQLLRHGFVRAPLRQQPLQLRDKEADHDGNGEEEEEDVHCDIPFIPASDSGSRLQNEFEILKWLGKGGFGDVIKVKNKLDGGLYAIKRIPLNPGNKQFTRKITREVKLLSRLNHENVVRYYNSWIETSQDSVPSASTSTLTSDTSCSVAPPPPPRPQTAAVRRLENSLGLPDDVEQLAPAAVGDASVEWSVSATGQDSADDDDDDDDDDNLADVFGMSFLPYSDSEDEGVAFAQDAQEDDAKAGDRSVQPSTTAAICKLQFLYIQMEFCEKSTLRTCIDGGLYEDMDRVWRLFREITDGLAHIHQQGMIHRDLKPVNIFLDSNDHVKIGDFGLATTDIISQQQSGIADMTFNPSWSTEHRMNLSSKSDSLGDGSLTGKVGTALYVSPEMMNTSTKTHYNQKVDLYSLGVMFFEMCYRPLETEMERAKVLSNLRLPTIQFPDDFDEVELPKQAAVLHWLLDHDPSRRPTSQELLQSDVLPPPVLHEAELHEVLRSTIAKPHGRSYQHMLAAMFSQRLPPANDFAYDSDLYKTVFSSRLSLMQRLVADTVEGVFRRHGALKVATPLLIPQCALYEKNESYVCMMDHRGGVVALPYDLRVHFARFVARTGISHLKRYSIGRVFRDDSPPSYGTAPCHPRALHACAFDIVTPTAAALVPDAEVLSVAAAIVTDMPAFASRRCSVRLNHTALLTAVFAHCGVQTSLHHEVYSILADTKYERQQRKLRVKTRLCGLSLPARTVDALYAFIEREGPLAEMASQLRCLTRSRVHAACAHAKRGLRELETLVAHARTLGCKLPAVLSLGLINSMQYGSATTGGTTVGAADDGITAAAISGGVIFQVVVDVRRKNKQMCEVIAAGGRYDHLIAEFRPPSSSVPTPQFAVGVSIAFDKLVTAAMESADAQSTSAVDVLVCCVGQKSFTREMLAVAAELWHAGLRVDVRHDTLLSLEELQDWCRVNGIAHMVILKDGDSRQVKIRSLEKDKIVEKKVAVTEVVEHLQKALLAQKQFEPAETGGTKQTSVNVAPNEMPNSHMTSGGGGANMPQFNVTFITQGNMKLAKNTKRTYETQIYSKLSTALAHVSHKSLVEVIGVDLNIHVLRTVAANLQLGTEETAFENSICGIIEGHLRHKKYLTKIFDHIHEMHFSKKCSVFLLYGLQDDSYKLLL